MIELRSGPARPPSWWCTSALTSADSSDLSCNIRVPAAAHSSSSTSSSGVRGVGRRVAITNSGTWARLCRIARMAARLDSSAQCRSSSTKTTGLSKHIVSSSSVTASAIRSRASADGYGPPNSPSPTIKRPMRARRGSADHGRSSSALTSAPKGRFRSKGCAAPLREAAPMILPSAAMRWTSTVLPIRPHPRSGGKRPLRAAPCGSAVGQPTARPHGQ